MPSKVAMEVSKRVKLKASDKPNLVLNLFRTYGFSDAQISKIVEKCPRALLAKPEATFSPKLSFFLSIGFSKSELPEFILSDCKILFLSLTKTIIPRYEALKSVLGDDDHASRAFKQWDWHNKDPTILLSNIEVLREHGVPQSSVCLSTSYSLCKGCEYRSGKTFIHAVSVLALTSKSTWESKLDIYERCGLSRDAILSAFGRFPNCMMLSEDKITSTMKFLVDDMSLSLVDIVNCPVLLGYSLEQRIIPRCSVFKILKTNSLIKRDISLCSLVSFSETKFLEKFVIPFQESVPRLLDIYKSRS
ncbi:uncharacterized protein LOC129317255 [Prosopis cineraria]|uniref:uncharacterized protein LOC129317255 n=1 Tax=Prosopis cineraria TaxID=364024 RepID=UPI0024107048|nr:uncharacterized protein LOC129317255 [Prosopis cineraria]